jgi:[acyl-carrier-protein] S-malonyltransferase
VTATAWMFPGQGSQRDSMWRNLPAGPRLLRAASELIGDDLAARCRAQPPASWPCEVLQPVLLTASVAAVAAATEAGLQPPVAVVGHSLGEYAALVAAEALSFETAVRVVRARGEAMDAAGAAAPGGMAAVIGGDPDVAAICAAAGEVWVANENSPRQVVISGRSEALSRACEQCENYGSVVIPLNVPVANHTPLMEPAVERVRELLDAASIRSPRVPFYSGVDGAPHDSAARLPELLSRAIAAPVKFRSAIEEIRAAGVTAFVELGPGRTLSRLVRETAPAATAVSACR